MPRLADLLLDFSHFIRLNVGGEDALPFHQGFFPFRRGHFRPARLGVNIAQVQVHGGVVRIALQRLAQRGLGVREFVLLEIYPTQTIEIRGVVRLFDKCALH